jgi:hypothetical protein
VCTGCHQRHGGVGDFSDERKTAAFAAAALAVEDLSRGLARRLLGPLRLSPRRRPHLARPLLGRRPAAPNGLRTSGFVGQTSELSASGDNLARDPHIRSPFHCPATEQKPRYGKL